ncbi:MAG: hypothetical protein RLZZ528_1858 [Pseudomonadota bacterium]|jgi:cytochrome b
MAGQHRPASEGPPDPWDPVVRLTHWVIALAVILNGLVTRGGSSFHVAIGWTAAALLILRLVWGLIGTPEARFSAFPPAPVAALGHLRAVLGGRPRVHSSHNPAGALMIYLLWASLATVIATGLTMTQASPMTLYRQEQAVAAGDWSALVAEGDGAGDDGTGEDKDTMHLVEDIHGTAANLMLILALIHVAGVAVESMALGRNLVRPMVRATRRGGRGRG